MSAEAFIWKDSEDPSWWDIDLAQGEMGERIVAQHLLETRGAGWEVADIGGKKREYDVMFANRRSSEVKTNTWIVTKKATPGGHNWCFVETSCSGKPSGIKVCQADYFITYYPFEGRIYAARTKHLKENLNKGCFRYGVGGKGLVDGVLMPRKYFHMEMTTKKFWEYDLGDKAGIASDLKAIYEHPDVQKRLSDWSSILE